MAKQVLMCIRNVAGSRGEILATKGSTYIMVDRSQCDTCNRKVVAVAEVRHPYVTNCIPGENWLPDSHFVPINDPNVGEEPENVVRPVERPKENAELAA